ncbi:sulfatase-like hydrolase/transferase [Parapedobacter tibetensis]|uniref:sulfatase-like hydrolase/transferase n=1 Tax=Parapedobacter tibetensis TaxID=2972951 RepID=UPI00214DBBC1|nr:sulfatase-like hydrolase/transferase [Parapedobacter tibetensis]
MMMVWRGYGQQVTRKGFPNIVIINMDDLGYGDVGAYGAQAIPTPHMDRLAHEGIRFTNGYVTSSTCTPSRFALMTGIYPWRNKDAKILPGTAPLLIDTAQQTFPKVLKQAGYHTGIVGKGHLGLGTGYIDWKGRIRPNVSDAVVCQIDLLASLAKLTGQQVEGTDSEDFLDTFLGESEQGREALVLEGASRTILRQGGLGDDTSLSRSGCRQTGEHRTG